jgi:hypothetical protein
MHVVAFGFVWFLCRPTHKGTPAPARAFKAAQKKKKIATEGHPNKTDGNPHNQNN